MIRSFSPEFGRFLASGAAQTVASYLLYLALLAFTHYQVAYTLSFAAGIVMAYALNTYYVFRTPWSWKSFLQFPSVYVVQYLTGIALMWLLVDRLGVDDRIAPWLIVVAQIPLTFLLSRRIIAQRRSG